MSNGSSVPGWVVWLLVILAVATLVLGYMVYNLNTHMGIMDAKGKALRTWAVDAAVWAGHVNVDHLKVDHEAMKVAPTHIPPPPNPPPEW